MCVTHYKNPTRILSDKNLFLNSLSVSRVFIYLFITCVKSQRPKPIPSSSFIPRFSHQNHFRIVANVARRLMGQSLNSMTYQHHQKTSKDELLYQCVCTADVDAIKAIRHQGASLEVPPNILSLFRVLSFWFTCFLCD